MRAVDIVERSKRRHWSINEHGMKGQATSLCHCEPVGVAATHKHLHMVQNLEAQPKHLGQMSNRLKKMSTKNEISKQNQEYETENVA